MKKVFSLVLSILMVFSSFSAMPIATYATDYCGTQTKASALVTGDTFEMGMYPQTKVTDDATLTALGAIDCTMTNYGYMQNSNASEHTFDAVDMTYADIAYNGEVYRKVTINQYRPYYTSGSSSNQSDNGYTTGNTYYFKWEPIAWQVLAKESDGVYVMSKTLLDSQAYNNYYEDTTWENCSLRTWLNDDFYAAAFSEDEQAKIVSITHDNEDSPYNSSVSGGNDTTDKLWVLSYSDAKNDAYGFSTDLGTADDARKAQGTDYAKSQGICVAFNGNSEWWLRSPGTNAIRACWVDDIGDSDHFSHVNYTDLGIRPAFKLNLTSEIFKSDPAICRMAGHSWDTEWQKDGTKHWHECTVCGAKKDEAAHSFEATARYCLNGCGAENPNYTGTPASTLTKGDTFEMGMYPQTKVTDDATITALNAVDCTMTNYGYMRNANASEHTFDAVDMTYADIAYNGEVYRKVTINQYRPYYTNTVSANNSQSRNGYTTGNTYYFKWEPIVWQVLAKESDGVYVMSKTLLDSQAYNNYYENTTWENCSLRIWLNDGFYNAAFSKNEKAKINSTTLHNEDSPYNTSVSGGNPTTDNLWVLSYSDAKNDAYGFNTDPATDDDARKVQGTDYAKSQGICVAFNGNIDWWLRSPGVNAHRACNVNEDGIFVYSDNVYYTDLGIRPAFKVNLDSTVGKSDPKEIKEPVTEISNYDELKAFAAEVNGGKTALKGKLMQDIVADSADWTPIGSESNKYMGTFDGGGHTISGLSNEDVAVKPEYAGLFGYLDRGGVIRNVGLLDGSIEGTNKVGAVAGFSEGLIQNCYNTGAVNATGDTVAAGGIVGTDYCFNSSSAILNCYNTGAVTANGTYVYAGGIVGNLTAHYGTVNISNCYNMGAATANGGNEVYAGGIAGKLWANVNTTVDVTKCYSVSPVNATGTLLDAGGVAGNVGRCALQNCYYDLCLCELSDAVGNEDDSVTVKGLTTAQMTGTNALTNMTGFSDTDWIVKADGYDEVSGKYYWFYPHLKGFNFNGSGEQKSAEDIGAADWPAKVEVAVTWNEPGSYVYTGSEIKPVVTAITVGGKALDSSDYTVSCYKKADDSWSTETVVPIDAGDYKAVIKFVDGHEPVTKAFTITPKELNIIVFGQQVYAQYNGTEQSHTGNVYWRYNPNYSDTTGFDESKFSYTGNTTVKGTNAGDYEITPSPEYCVYNDSNYTVNFTSESPVKMTISPTALDITAENKQTNHGDDLAGLTYTIKSYHGYYYNENELDIGISTNADKNKPGTYAISLTVEDNPNYDIRTFDGTYTVGNSPHTWGDVKYTWNGTASVTAERKCIYCEEAETETKATTPQQTKDPTCTEKGETTYTVTFDNPAFVKQEKTVDDVPAPGHNYQKTVTDPTCTAKGYTTYTCSRGDDEYVSDYVDELGHDWATEWSKDKTEHWHDCSRCSEVNDKAAHNYAEPTYTWNGTASVTAERVCDCGWKETETKATTSEQTKPETCTENGETTYTVTFENPAFETQSMTIADVPALGHNYSKAVTDPTCTEQGYTTYTCSRGDDEYKDDYVDALGHTMKHYPAKAPTSTEDGNIEYWVCGVCGKYYADENGNTEITDPASVVLPAVPVYSFVGDKVTYTKDSNKPAEFTVKRSLDDEITFDNFTGIEIDGKKVDSDSYDASKGSVNISLKPSYLNTLSVGEHTLKVNFTDGEAETKFNVAATQKADEPNADAKKDNSMISPATGDETAWFETAAMTAGCGLLYLALSKKKRKGHGEYR
ncbi:MAG: hypothetical protein IJJ41_07210 [Clostridia bacterium]|nr:hypothetical protein [Clostridia bacterium]